MLSAFAPGQPFRFSASLVLLLLVSACALETEKSSAHYFADWRAVAKKNPMEPGENIRVVELGRDASGSHHLVRIRDREKNHLHSSHDLTVFVLDGAGEMDMNGVRHQVSAGDVFVVPRGMPHYFVNTGSDPAAAHIFFQPPLLEPDIVPVP